MTLSQAHARAKAWSDKRRYAVVKAFGQAGGPYWSEELTATIPFDDIVAVYEYETKIRYAIEQHTLAAVAAVRGAGGEGG